MDSGWDERGRVRGGFFFSSSCSSGPSMLIATPIRLHIQSVRSSKSDRKTDNWCIFSGDGSPDRCVERRDTDIPGH